METSVLQIIERVGFPIFVAAWFMLRLEKRLDKLIDAVMAVTKGQEVVLHELTQQGGVPEELSPESNTTRRRRLPTREGT